MSFALTIPLKRIFPVLSGCGLPIKRDFKLSGIVDFGFHSSASSATSTESFLSFLKKESNAPTASSGSPSSCGRFASNQTRSFFGAFSCKLSLLGSLKRSTTSGPFLRPSSNCRSSRLSRIFSKCFTGKYNNALSLKNWLLLST